MQYTHSLHRFRRLACGLAPLLALVLAACGNPEPQPASSGQAGAVVAADGSLVDSAAVDGGGGSDGGGTADAGDAVAGDAGATDTAQSTDSQAADATVLDTTSDDTLATSDAAAIADTLVADAGSMDTGTPDTGTPDTGTPDTGAPDTGAPDTGAPDTGTPDAGSPDAGGDTTTCTPATCASLKVTCGPANDGCGGKLDCGTCPTTCAQTCPNGWTCSTAGVCESANLSGIVLPYQVFQVSGSITLNGKAPTMKAGCKSYDGIAKVTFKEKTLGYELTDYVYCKDKSFNWQRSIYPGTYEVWVGGYDPSGSTYKNQSDLGTLPQRVYTELKLTKATAGLVLAYQRFDVSGTITLNGKKPTIAADCKSYDGIAKVTLKEPTLGYTLTDYLRCKDGGFDWKMAVYPGTYEVWVGGYDPSGSTYKNKSDLGTLPQRVYTGLKLSKATSGLVLNYQRFSVSGGITLNGKAPQMKSGCTGYHGLAKVTLKEKTLGYELTDYIYCKDGGFDWKMAVYPGTYEVWVGGYDPSGSTYKNKSDLGTLQQRVYAGLKLSKDTAGLVLNFQRFEVSGAITLNGKKPTMVTGCTGYHGIAKVTLKEPTLGYVLNNYLYCKDGKFDWQRSAYPGTYEVWVGGYDPSGSTYKNKSDLGTLQQRVYTGLKLSKDTTGLVLDYRRFTVSGVITKNGKKPQITAGCKSSDGIAKVVFEEQTLGYVLTRYLYCKDGAFDWSLSVYPGTYDVRVGGHDPSGSTYKNKSDLRTLPQRVFTGLKLSKQTVGLVLPYKDVKVDGTILRNGSTPTIDAGCKSSDGIARVRFVEHERDYAFSRYLYCKDGKFDWDMTIYPGTYEVWVGGFDPSSSYYSNKSDLGTLLQRVYKALLIQ